MATKIKEDPSRDQGDDSNGRRACGSRGSESEESGYNPKNLNGISAGDRKPGENFAFSRAVVSISNRGVLPGFNHRFVTN